MPANVIIEGVACDIEKLPNANIRVRGAAPQFNPMNGPNTGGEIAYEVHPCQRHQYAMLNAQLPPQEQAMPEGFAADQKPWWSLGAGERANLRE